MILIASLTYLNIASIVGLEQPTPTGSSSWSCFNLRKFWAYAQEGAVKNEGNSD
jgi:hypothetical protein